MKAIADKIEITKEDHFTNDLAPINRPRHAVFGAVDGVMLLVLAMEVVVVMRLLLAK
jgi:hypothetical protein